MGEAKKRGTYEQRVEEGKIKQEDKRQAAELAREQRRIAHQARYGSKPNMLLAYMLALSLAGSSYDYSRHK